MVLLFIGGPLKNKKVGEERAENGDGECGLQLLLGETMDALEEVKQLRQNNIPAEKKLPKNVNKSFSCNLQCDEII